MCFSIKGVEDMKVELYRITKRIVEIDGLGVETMYVLERVKNVNETTGEVYNKDTDIIITSTKRGDCVKHRKSLTGGK